MLKILLCLNNNATVTANNDVSDIAKTIIILDIFDYISCTKMNRNAMTYDL